MTAKSDRAKELLSDPLLQEGFEALRHKYRSAMGNPQVPDDDILELRRMLFLLDKLESHLSQVIADGEIEDFRVAEQERPSFLGDIWNRKDRQTRQ